MLHKNEYFSMGELSIFIGGSIPICTQLDEFGKSADSASWFGELSHQSFLCSDNWSLRFSVRWLRLAHFLFSPRNIYILRRKENEKNIRLQKIVETAPPRIIVPAK